MKKTIIALVFILAFAVIASGEPTDLVLLLDTSASMSDSYRETSDYLIGPFLREFLRLGDTFHLISFSGSPRLEISRRVEGIGDIEAIIGRLLLMYPLEPELNLADALTFAENFTSSLSAAKPKKIVLLTDVPADDDTQNLIDQASERLQGLGADLQYISAPVTGTGPSSGRPREYISSAPTTTTPPPATTTTPPTTATTPPTTATTPPPAATTTPVTPTTTTPPATTTTPPTATTTTTPPATTTTPPPATTTTPPATTTTPPAVTSTTPPATTTTLPPATTTTPPPAVTTTPPPATTTTPPAVTSTTPPATTTTTPTATTTTPPSATTTTPPAVTSTTPPATTTTPPPTATTTEPQSQTQAAESSSRTGYGISLRLLILILLNLLVLGLIIFFVVRNLHKSPNRAVAKAAVSSTRTSTAPASYTETRQSPVKPSQAPVNYAEARQSPGSPSTTLASYAEARQSSVKPSQAPVNYTEARQSPGSPSPAPASYGEARQSPGSPSTMLASYAEARQSPGSPSSALANYAEARQSQVNPSQALASYAEARRTQASPPPESSQPKRKPLPKDKAYEESSEESLMLNLFVADQNTAIGRRNIHSVKAGHKFSIGGGKSDFLIFLVPIPPKIAELQYDGRNCTLTPKKPQYFPDLGPQQIPACIGKNIRVVSDRNYELYIRFEKYEDPLKALNRLMNSILVPGERRE